MPVHPSAISPSAYWTERESDDDDTSLDSDPDKSYDIERILCEDNNPGQTYFLVKWKGYDNNRCSWEPRESFDDDATFEEWEKQKKNGDFLDEDQLEAMEAEMEEYRAEKEKRKLLRHNQRKQARQRQENPSKRRSSTENSSIEGSHDATAPDPKRRQSIPAGLVPPSRPILNPSSPSTHRPTVFHGIENRPKARRAANMHNRRILDAASPRAGQRFFSLRHANNFNKLARSEPAPDLSSVKLKPVDQWVSKDADTAHILPPGGPIGAEPALGKIRREEPPAVARPASQSQQQQLAKAPAHHDELIAPLPRQQQRIDEQQLMSPNRFTWWGGFNHQSSTRDLIVDAAFGNYTVGKLRLVGLPNPLRREMILTKISPNELPVVFKEEHVLKIDQYEKLCRGVGPSKTPYPVRFHADLLQLSNAILTIVSIDPFDVAADNANSLAEHLEMHSLAALWAPGPEVSTPQMMILYPPREPWLFLERDLPAPLPSRLRIAIRNLMPTPMRVAEDYEHGIQVPASVWTDRPSAGIQNKSAEQIMTHEGPRAASNFNAAALPSTEQNMFTTIREIPAKRPETATSHRSAPPSPASNTAKLRDPSALKITYERLTVTRPVAGLKYKLDRNLARFYLAFDALDELDCLRAYLCKHTLPKLIYTSKEEGDWETFKATLGSTGEYVGVILFHKDWTRYSTLPGLSKLLMKDNPNIFRISLKERIPDCPFGHLDRIFQRGMVLLVTEGAMLADHVTALSILQWFSKVQNKNKAGGSKLMLRPNAEQFLRHTASNLSPEARKGLLDMLVLLNEMQPGFSKPAADIASDCEFVNVEDCHVDSDVIVSPTQLSGYEETQDPAKSANEANEFRLVEYFVGWSLQNVRTYRRFVAVTTLAPEAFVNFHHLDVFSPDGFLRAVNKSKPTKSR